MLTREQADSLHIKVLKGQAVDLTELIKHAYAAGAKDMQERCAKAAEAVTVGQPHLLTVTETHVMDITAIEAGRAIRALKESK